MLGHSYDLKCAIDAISILNERGYSNIKLFVMGDGPLKEEFKQYAIKKKINSEFTGRLSYDEMVGCLVKVDVALNLISHGAVQGIINKHADCLSAGLPIINNQEVDELGVLLDKYLCGINCKNSDAYNVADAMEKLVADIFLRKRMGVNARKLAEERFCRKKSYAHILELIQDGAYAHE